MFGYTKKHENIQVKYIKNLLGGSRQSRANVDAELNEKKRITQELRTEDYSYV